MDINTLLANVMYTWINSSWSNNNRLYRYYVNLLCQVLGDIQNALQQAMIAACLQLLNPMLRAQMPPGMNALNQMAMMGGGVSPFGPPGMGQFQHLQQLAMACSRCQGVQPCFVILFNLGFFILNSFQVYPRFKIVYFSIFLK